MVTPQLYRQCCNFFSTMLILDMLGTDLVTLHFVSLFMFKCAGSHAYPAGERLWESRESACL